MNRVILWDASALLRLLWASERSPEVYAQAERMIENGDDLRTVVHSLRECYATLTRPVAANGYAVSVPQARGMIESLGRRSTITLLPDPPQAYGYWLDLCERQQVRGILCHDAYLAACVLTLDVPIYALDRDFARFGVRTP